MIRTGHIIARRAVMKKDGCSDLRAEVKRDSDTHVTLIENGRPIQTWYGKLIPERAMRGEGLPIVRVEHAWESWMAERYPDFSVTETEDYVTE